MAGHKNREETQDCTQRLRPVAAFVSLHISQLTAYLMAAPICTAYLQARSLRMYTKTSRKRYKKKRIEPFKCFGIYTQLSFWEYSIFISKHAALPVQLDRDNGSGNASQGLERSNCKTARQGHHYILHNSIGYWLHCSPASPAVVRTKKSLYLPHSGHIEEPSAPA